MTRYITCPECGRRFDLWDEGDADEWFTGHDCEVDDSQSVVGVDDEA